AVIYYVAMISHLGLIRIFLRPLLFLPFGDGEYCLYILPELNDELSNRRLKSQFPWVDEVEHTENRKHFPTVGRKQKSRLKIIFNSFRIIFSLI
ncbi:hypothetical protein ACED30_25260, partial [Vibrio splendidus]